jgi:DNA-binding transcriptional ArsR family regulator
VTKIFEVLAEPHRRRIVELLRTEERSVNDLVMALGISQPAVSKHLRVLKDAGVVAVHPDAQRRLYTLRPEPLMELDTWLDSYRSLWEERFNRLDDYLREIQQREE